MAGTFVMFFHEVCKELRVSPTTGKRLIRAGMFPIPEPPSLDKRPRYSSRDGEAYKARETGLRPMRRRAS